MQRKITRNAESKPKGFPWDKRREAFHATVAMRKILEEGFKMRRQIGGKHATGGGPDNAISFTLNKNTATAIALGIYTIRGIGRGEILLGDLIIQASQVAPVALEYARKRLAEEGIDTPEDIARVDLGMEKFRLPKDFGFKGDDVLLDAIVSSGEAEIIEETKWTLAGWVPSRIVEAAEAIAHPDDRYYSSGLNKRYRRVTYEMYRRLLNFGSAERELYDPCFFMTDVGPITMTDPSDIGVVSATIDADWICAGWEGAKSLGYDYDVSPSTLSSWASGCDMELGSPTESSKGYHRTLLRGWDPPSRHDTVSYLWAMSEVRVYDTDLIKNVDEYLDIGSVINRAQDAWDRKGHIIDDPYFMPYHPEQPW